MDLFAVLPDRFFTVLASPGRHVYAHLLFLLYDFFRDEPFGIARDLFLDAAAAYLEEAGVPADLLDEGEAGPAGVQEAGTTGVLESGAARLKAAAVLRRLQETGWVTVEVRADYEEFVNLTDHAIQVLEVLDRIRTGRRPEYAGYVYATYSILLEAERGDPAQAAIALDQAADRTEALLRELKSLFHNIQRHTARVLAQRAPREVLALHFEEYKAQILDRSYHRLKTTDNVSRYRPRILAVVRRWLADEAWLQQVAAEWAARRGLDPAAARAEVVERLRRIRAAYEGMDDLLEAIDRKNAQYARASLEQVRYLLASSQDLAGQIARLIAAAAPGVRDGEAGLPEGWERLFNLHTVALLDPGSLWRPRQARMPHRPRELDADPVPEDRRQAAQRRAALRLLRRITPERVRRWVEERLGDRGEARASELGIASVEDWLYLIYTAAYSTRRDPGYRVEFGGPEVTAAGGRFRFRDFVVRRRGGEGGRSGGVG